MTFKHNPPMPGVSPAPNMLMEGDGFYVSFNPHDTSVFGSETTALEFGQMQKFYVASMPA